MRSKTTLPAAFTISLFLGGCGGGFSNPYDGSWSAVFPVADKSAISATETVLCNTVPAPLVLRDGAGSTTQSVTCTTTILATATTPVQTYLQASDYHISVSIDGKGVVNASVNGATFTGQCISTAGCSAASAAGDTLSLTR